MSTGKLDGKVAAVTGASSGGEGNSDHMAQKGKSCLSGTTR